MIIFLIAFLALLFSPLSIEDVSISIVLIGLFIVLGQTFITYLYNKRFDFAPMFLFLYLYLLISYVLKYILVLYDQSLIWGVDHNIFYAASVLSDIAPRFYELAPGLICFCAAIALSAPRKNIAKPPHRTTKSDLARLAIICYGLVIIRFIGHIFFNIGMPLEVGTGLPGPILALYEYIVGVATIVVLNLAFYYVWRSGHRNMTVIISIALAINIALSLYASQKGELVIQVFALFYYFVIHRMENRVKIKRSHIAYIVVFSIITLAIYPYINLYRFTYSRSGSIAQALYQTQEYASLKSDQDNNAVTLIFKRVAGIDKYYPAVTIGKQSEVPATVLLDNSMSLLLKEALLGSRADEIRRGIGSSQFAVFYLLGGVLGLVFFSILLGVIMRWVFELMFTKVITYRDTCIAYTPFLAYFYIKILLTGGNWSLIFNQFVIVAASVVFLERFAVSRGAPKQAPLPKIQ